MHELRFYFLAFVHRYPTAPTLVKWSEQSGLLKSKTTPNLHTQQRNASRNQSRRKPPYRLRGETHFVNRNSLRNASSQPQPRYSDVQQFTGHRKTETTGPHWKEAESSVDGPLGNTENTPEVTAAENLHGGADIIYQNGIQDTYESRVGDSMLKSKEKTNGIAKKRLESQVEVIPHLTTSLDRSVNGSELTEMGRPGRTNLQSHEDNEDTDDDRLSLSMSESRKNLPQPANSDVNVSPINQYTRPKVNKAELEQDFSGVYPPYRSSMSGGSVNSIHTLPTNTSIAEIPDYASSVTPPKLSTIKQDEEEETWRPQSSEPVRDPHRIRLSKGL